MSHRTGSRSARVQLPAEVTVAVSRGPRVPHVSKSTKPRRAKKDDSEDEYATADEGDKLDPRYALRVRSHLQGVQRLERAHTLPPRPPAPMVPSRGRPQEDGHQRKLAPSPLLPPVEARRAPFVARAAPSKMYARNPQREPGTHFPGKSIPVASIPFPKVEQSRARDGEVNRRRLNVNKKLPRSPSPGSERRRSGSMDSAASYNSQETDAPRITPESRKQFDHAYSNVMQSARESVEEWRLGRKPQYTLSNPNRPFYDLRMKWRTTDTYENCRDFVENAEKTTKKVAERVRRNSLTIVHAAQDLTWEAEYAAKNATKEVKQAAKTAGKEVKKLARRVSQELHLDSMAGGIRRVMSRTSFSGAREPLLATQTMHGRSSASLYRQSTESAE
ncbi:hypothetical protein AURDEDRAFT_126242 [Auricularia subglabra TFB-10046 SS5]|nr:hypothetical protein AURDEDRAFT_126242 [Auricularia subglabra TFB-10046 SS5]